MIRPCMTAGHGRDIRAKFWPRCRTRKNEARMPHLLIDLLLRCENLQRDDRTQALANCEMEAQACASFAKFSGVFLMSMPAAAHAPEADPRAPRRVRHDARRRTLTIKQVDKIAAHMIRITLTGDLEGFTSLGFDDHVKLFFPDGTMNAEGAPNAMGRDFTPRRYDHTANTLEIDFAIHDAGPATQWATQAKRGQTLALGGPRGSFIIPTTFDWHLLVGDETGLPAISRRLAELPAGTKAVVLCEVDGPGDEIKFDTKADVAVTWAHRNGAAAGLSETLTKALSALKMPAGDYYAWVACESLVAKDLRRQLIANHSANPKWMRAAGYWRRGAVAIHEVHDN
jgi:NADPH-dependent ferric siderophore reductase